MMMELTVLISQSYADEDGLDNPTTRKKEVSYLTASYKRGIFLRVCRESDNTIPLRKYSGRLVAVISSRHPLFLVKRVMFDDKTTRCKMKYVHYFLRQILCRLLDLIHRDQPILPHLTGGRS